MHTGLSVIQSNYKITKIFSGRLNKTTTYYSHPDISCAEFFHILITHLNSLGYFALATKKLIRRAR